MKRLLFLVGNCMAAFQDFGIGACITALIGYSLGVDIVWWHLIIGGFLGFFPDLFDIAPTLLLGKIPPVGTDHHQTFFHRPLYFIPVCTFAAGMVDTFFIGHLFWTIVVPTCIIYHFWHDTDYGLAIFYPFEKRYWVKHHGFMEPNDAEKVNGIGLNHIKWIVEIWYRPTPYSLREVLTGSFGLGIAVTLISNLSLGAFTTAFFMIGALLRWVFVYLCEFVNPDTQWM